MITEPIIGTIGRYRPGGMTALVQFRESEVSVLVPSVMFIDMSVPVSGVGTSGRNDPVSMTAQGAAAS